MPTVFVIGRDWTLRTAVRAELREVGLEALGFETSEEALAASAAGRPPEAVVVDITSAQADEAALATWARQSVLVAVVSGVEALPKLVSGVIVLKKPVRVAEIVAAVRQLMEGRPA